MISNRLDCDAGRGETADSGSPKAIQTESPRRASTPSWIQIRGRLHGTRPDRPGQGRESLLGIGPLRLQFQPRAALRADVQQVAHAPAVVTPALVDDPDIRPEAP